MEAHGRYPARVREIVCVSHPVRVRAIRAAQILLGGWDYWNIGTLAGTMNGADVWRIDVTSTIWTSTYDPYRVGGVVGNASGSRLTDLVVDIEATSAKSLVTGVVSDATTTNIRRVAASVVLDGFGVAGIAGFFDQGHMIDGHVEGDVEAKEYASGGVHWATDSALLRLAADVSVRGKRAGGLIGSAFSSTLDEVRASGSVTGEAQAGGLVATVGNSALRDCMATGDVLVTGTGTIDGASAGGLATGISQGSTVTRCYSAGRVENLSGPGPNLQTGNDGYFAEGGILMPFVVLCRDKGNRVVIGPGVEQRYTNDKDALGLESVVPVLLIGATTRVFAALRRWRLALRPRNVYPRVPDWEERAMTSDTRAQWRWLAGTYWYVLPIDLPALNFDPDDAKLTWLIDQTVWHISDYANGYFWGVAAVMMYDAGERMPQRGPASRIAHLSLLGTVLPDGKVQITFIPRLRGTSGATTGFGQIVEIGGAWVVEMQMSTDRLGARVLHWANMVQTREGDPSWERLPGLTHSVPEMLDGAVYPRLDAG